MAWSQTYSHDVLIGLDQLACCLFFGRADLTVSGLCEVVRQADAGVAVYQQRLASLKLRPWQIGALRKIAAGLERMSPGHCAAAALSDIARGQSMQALLTPPDR